MEVLNIGNSLDKSLPDDNVATPSLPDEILIEILSRLPVKSLMQFKSVCKHWLFYIKYNRQLIDLHSNRSKSRPNFLYINPLPEKGLHTSSVYLAFIKSQTLQQSISWGQMVDDSSGGDSEQVEAIISNIKIADDKCFLYNQVLEPVNGLICYVDTETYAIKVHNASTREATPWITSTLLAEEKNKFSNKQMMSLGDPIYRFGFDPENREHKVFCFWRLVSAKSRRHNYSSKKHADYESWEALTVGRDTKWRRINAVSNENNQIKIKEALPPRNSLTRQVYADGTIYWSNKAYYKDLCGRDNRDDPDVIVAFDVGSETYRVITIPNFIVDEPRDVELPIGMVVLGGYVALLYQMKPNVVKLWMLDDRADKKLENCRGYRNDWRSETITLPFCFDNTVGVFGIAGSTDKILFERRGKNFTCLYSYDRKKKTLKKIEMDGVSSFTLESDRSLITTFTESLFHVQPTNKTEVSDESSFVSSSSEITENLFAVQPLNKTLEVM